MANKKQKKLKKNLSTVKGQLTKTEKKLAKSTDRTERWKKEAKAHKKSAAKAGARADLLAEQLDEALQSAPSQAEVEAASADEPGAEGQTLDGAGTPDKDWSVVQLRAEARARGLTGLSRASKADLIAALT